MKTSGETKTQKGSGSAAYLENAMKKIRNSLIALIALVATTAPVSAGIEVLGIEVLGIEVLGIEVLGIEVLQTRTLGAPAGSQTEAVMTVNGIQYTVAAATIDPSTGLATLTIPAGAHVDTLITRGPQGEVLDAKLIDFDLD